MTPPRGAAKVGGVTPQKSAAPMTGRTPPRGEAKVAGTTPPRSEPVAPQKVGFHQLPTLLEDPAAQRYASTGRTPTVAPAGATPPRRPQRGQNTDELAAEVFPKTGRLIAIGVAVLALLGLALFFITRR
jgi:hypothetical protein